MAQKPRERLGIRAPKAAEAPPQVPGRPDEPEGGAPSAGVLQDDEAPENLREAKARIEELLKAVGTDVMQETQLPVAKNRNNAEQAREYVTADMMRRVVETRFKAAKEAAEKAGVFGSESEYVAGETVMVWNSPHYAISMKMGKETQTINKEAVEAALVKHLGAEKAAQVLEECLKPRAAPKQVIVSMK